jgi:hypothetical protein
MDRNTIYLERQRRATFYKTILLVTSIVVGSLYYSSLTVHNDPVACVTADSGDIICGRIANE